MERHQFRKASNDFVNWAGTFDCEENGYLQPSRIGELSQCSATLNIPRSTRVPSAIQCQRYFYELLQVYSWRATGMDWGDFGETRKVIGLLTEQITKARTSKDLEGACLEILRWGGVRNRAVGAMPFLKARPDLVGYLDAVKNELTLDTAIVSPDRSFVSVLRMNSVLTKLHSFHSGDGLPIYDSRVAGAVAALIETWRQASGRSAKPIPFALKFPSVGGGGPRRTVSPRYLDCHHPGTLYYPAKQQGDGSVLLQTGEWASAKVRLGWLLSELLTKPTPAGIRSLEACLFMAGYDCSGINA